MKSIGILTFHQSVNNGAVMQSYSLAKRLQRDFPQCHVEIVDYNMERVYSSYHRYGLRSYIAGYGWFDRMKLLAKFLLDPLMFRRLNHRSEVFDESRTKLPLSTFSLISNSVTELESYLGSTYDVLVVGSDAVWNYISRGFPNAYFPSLSVNCEKLSYAASCYGMEFLSQPEELRVEIGKRLSDFRFLGVRDKATEDFVRWSGCGNSPIHTCDPTVYLDVESLPINIELLKEKMIRRGFDFNKPAIGMMGTSHMCEMIRAFYGKRYQIVALYEYVRGADVNLYDIEPFEWAYVFRYFRLTFTTYFHGTMLSLRNGIPVICIALNTPFSAKHTPKTLDVLERLGYGDWYFHTDYRTSNLDCIKAKADELLASDLNTEILSAMEREAESYMPFANALSGCIDMIRNGN